MRIVLCLLLLLVGRTASAQTVMVFGDDLAADFATGQKLVRDGGQRGVSLSSETRGDRPADAESRIMGELAEHAPDIVLVMAGANETGPLPDQTEEEWLFAAERALVSIVRRSKRSGAKVVIASLPPERGGGARVGLLNATIAKVAQRTSIPVLDIHGMVTADRSYSAGDALSPAGKLAVWKAFETLTTSQAAEAMVPEEK